jgi:anti-sigma B factor antagonist
VAGRAGHHPAATASNRAAALKVEVIADPSGLPALKLTGELDVASAPTLQAAIDPVMERRPPKIAFDLSELRFMDSSGISLFLATAERIAVVELRHPPPTVRRIFELTGITGVFEIIG